jgi:hypothetical protein
MPIRNHDLPGGEKSLSSSRVTTDSVQQVADFYKAKMKVDTANVTSELATILGKSSDGDIVRVDIKKEDRGTTIGLGVEVTNKSGRGASS